MQITRNNHLRYMTRLTPFLALLYVVQIALYWKFAGLQKAGDTILILGVGLVFIIGLFHFYDWHHKIVFKPNYIETRFDILKMREEILYRDVTFIEVKESKHYYGKITLHTRQGECFALHHVDSPELVAQYIEKKRSKQI